MLHIKSLLILWFMFSSMGYAALSSDTVKVKELRIRKDLVTTQYVLKNGLTVVLTQNPKAPVTSVIHWVKAGSLHETPGITGIAHLFEHMMFRPLSKKEPNFMARVSQLGGQGNANTRFGSTVYMTSVPHNHVEALLKMESDRFRNLKVTDDLLNTERKAVWSEYNTKMDSNPVVDLWDSIYRVGFKYHPYGWFIIGFREDLEKIKALDCNRFFSKYYRPNNTGLFISGNVDMNQVLKWVQKYYGPWKRGEDAVLPAPFQYNAGAVIGKGKLKSTSKSVLAGYRIPEFDGKNQHILNFVNHVFFNTNFNLVKRRLVLQKKLISESMSFNWDYDMGLMKVLLVLLPTTSIDAAISELNKLPEDFSNLSDEEFNAYVDNYKINRAEYLLRNYDFDYATALSWGKEGSIDYLKESIEDIKLSKTEVNDFLKKYFRNENLVFVTNREE